MMTVGDAWRKFSSNILFYIVAGVLPGLLVGGLSMVGLLGFYSRPTEGTSIIIMLLGYVFTILGSLAMIQKERDDEVVLGQTQLGMLDFTNVFTIAWKSVLMGVIISIIGYVVGLSSVIFIAIPILGWLLLVPYIVVVAILSGILSIVVTYVIYIKPHLSIMDILRDSINIVKADWVRVLKVLCVTVLLLFAGLIAMGVGLLITLPISVVYSVSHMVAIVDGYYNKDSAIGKVEVADDLMGSATVDTDEVIKAPIDTDELIKTPIDSNGDTDEVINSDEV